MTYSTLLAGECIHHQLIKIHLIAIRNPVITHNPQWHVKINSYLIFNTHKSKTQAAIGVHAILGNITLLLVQ